MSGSASFPADRRVGGVVRGERDAGAAMRRRVGVWVACWACFDLGVARGVNGTPIPRSCEGPRGAPRKGGARRVEAVLRLRGDGRPDDLRRDSPSSARVRAQRERTWSCSDLAYTFRGVRRGCARRSSTTRGRHSTEPCRRPMPTTSTRGYGPAARAGSPRAGISAVASTSSRRASITGRSPSGRRLSPTTVSSGSAWVGSRRSGHVGPSAMNSQAQALC